MSKVVVECKNLAKVYHDGKITVNVLSNLNLKVSQGEQLAIVGPSGAGKSTLLHLLGGLDKPSSGEVFWQGQNVYQLSEARRCQLRNEQLGFIYQMHYLLPEFSVLENATIPLLLQNISIKDASQRAEAMLENVGLSHRLQHKVSELSGGERQRTAIARALVTRPMCVFADEPTGNLDQKTADKVYDTMLNLNRELGTSFVVVTHDNRLAERMDKILTI